MLSTGKNLYHVLEIEKNASIEEIKSAYRRLSLIYHPDRNSSAHEKFVDIQNAYEILSDPNKRNRYDAENSATTELAFTIPTTSFNPNDNNSIVVRNAYGVKDIIKKSRLSKDELENLAIQNKEVALIILEDKELTEKMMYRLESISLKHEIIAERILSDAYLCKRISLFNLAEKYLSSCQTMLSNFSLCQSFTGRELSTLVAKHGQIILDKITQSNFLFSRLQAYKKLITEHQQLSAIDISKYIKLSALEKDDLVFIAKKHESIALAIFEDPELIQLLGIVWLLALGEKYDSVAMKILNNKLLWPDIKKRDFVLDLLLKNRSACIYFISNNELSSNLNGASLYKLSIKHGAKIRDKINQEITLAVKLQAYEILLTYHQQTDEAFRPLTIVEQFELKKNIITADLDAADLERLALIHENLALTICEDRALINILGIHYLTDIGIKFEKISNLIFSLTKGEHQFYYNTECLYKLALAHLSACKSALSNDWSRKLDGNQLYNLTKKHGEIAVELINSNPILSECLQAYILLVAGKNAGLNISKQSVNNSKETGEADYETGIFYQNKQMSDSRQIAHNYFLKAAQKGYQLALEKLIEYAETDGIKIPENKFNIALIYADRKNSLFDEPKSLQWFSQAAVLGHFLSAQRLSDYLCDRIRKFAHDYKLENSFMEVFQKFAVNSVPSAERDLLYQRLANSFVSGGHPSQALSFFELCNHLTDENLFTMGNLQLEVIAANQQEELSSVTNEEEMSEKLTSPNLRKVRLLTALPYFLRAAKLNHSEATILALNLLAELLSLGTINQQILLLVLENEQLKKQLTDEQWQVIAIALPNIFINKDTAQLIFNCIQKKLKFATHRWALRLIIEQADPVIINQLSVKDCFECALDDMSIAQFFLSNSHLSAQLEIDHLNDLGNIHHSLLPDILHFINQNREQWLEKYKQSLQTGPYHELYQYPLLNHQPLFLTDKILLGNGVLLLLLTDNERNYFKHVCLNTLKMRATSHVENHQYLELILLNYSLCALYASYGNFSKAFDHAHLAKTYYDKHCSSAVLSVSPLVDLVFTMLLLPSHYKCIRDKTISSLNNAIKQKHIDDQSKKTIEQKQFLEKAITQLLQNSQKKCLAEVTRNNALIKQKKQVDDLLLKLEDHVKNLRNSVTIYSSHSKAANDKFAKLVNDHLTLITDLNVLVSSLKKIANEYYQRDFSQEVPNNKMLETALRTTLELYLNKDSDQTTYYGTIKIISEVLAGLKWVLPSSIISFYHPTSREQASNTTQSKFKVRAPF